MDKQVITPDLWGPHGWKFLHYLSFGYPMDPTTEHKNQYKTFFFIVTTRSTMLDLLKTLFRKSDGIFFG